MFASRKILAIAIALMAFVAPSPPAMAVDSWLVTESDTLDADKPAWIALITGDAFPIADGIIDPARVDQLIDQFDTQRIPIEGLRAEDDAMSARYPFDRPGIHILGVTLYPRLITLDGDVFDQYLIEERANDALAARKNVAARQQPVRERYTKYAKTIVEVGAVNDGDRDYLKPVGHRLEIIPMTNPTRWQTGEVIELQVLLDGHPWPEVPVTAGHAGQSAADAVMRARTNERGVASIRLTQSGHWYIKAHLIRPYDGLGECDWESFWTTYTFRVKGKVDVSGSLQMLRAIHGRIDPWAVAGFLMGERALIELGLPYGSDDLLAVQHGPAELPYSAMLDGIQAATGATGGKLNLKLKPADADDLRCEFLHMSTGEGVVFRLQKDMLKKLSDDEDADSLAVRMMAMPLDEIFDGTSDRSGPQPGPSDEDAQTRAWENARLRETQLKPLIRLASARQREWLVDENAPSVAIGDTTEASSNMEWVVTDLESSNDDGDLAPPSPAATEQRADEIDGHVRKESRKPRRKMGLAESLWRANKKVRAEKKNEKEPLSPALDANPAVRVTAR